MSGPYPWRTPSFHAYLERELHKKLTRDVPVMEAVTNKLLAQHLQKIGQGIGERVVADTAFNERENMGTLDREKGTYWWKEQPEAKHGHYGLREPLGGFDPWSRAANRELYRLACELEDVKQECISQKEYAARLVEDNSRRSQEIADTEATNARQAAWIDALERRLEEEKVVSGVRLQILRNDGVGLNDRDRRIANQEATITSLREQLVAANEKIGSPLWFQLPQDTDQVSFRVVAATKIDYQSPEVLKSRLDELEKRLAALEPHDDEHGRSR